MARRHNDGGESRTPKLDRIRAMTASRKAVRTAENCPYGIPLEDWLAGMPWMSSRGERER